MFLQALFDLEATNNELKADLRDLYITAAREIDVAGSSRKAIIVHVSGRCRAMSSNSRVQCQEQNQHSGSNIC